MSHQRLHKVWFLRCPRNSLCVCISFRGHEIRVRFVSGCWKRPDARAWNRGVDSQGVKKKGEGAHMLAVRPPTRSGRTRVTRRQPRGALRHVCQLPEAAGESTTTPRTPPIGRAGSPRGGRRGRLGFSLSSYLDSGSPVFRSRRGHRSHDVLRLGRDRRSDVLRDWSREPEVVALLHRRLLLARSFVRSFFSSP